VLQGTIPRVASLFSVRAFAISIVIVAAATVVQAAPAGSLLPGTKRPAPALAGVDPVTGKQVSLAHWKGRAVLVNLWGSWCRPCREEARELKRFAARHPGSILGIDVEDSKPGARAFYRRHGVRYPSIFDPHDVLVHKLQAGGTPTTFFLDRRHRVVAVLLGAGTLRDFERGFALASK
jgi:thiol-disulfide isomerase/thioredoxin